MAACQAGDREAFRELFRRHAGRLNSYFLAMCGDPEDAMDLTQETWVKVWRGRGSWDSARPFRPWLFGIASRTRIDFLRSWARKLGRLSVSVSRDAREGEAPAPELPAPAGSDPARLAEQSEAGAAVHRALPRVEERQRQAVVLHDLSGFTCQQVAAMLGCPLGTVLTRLRRGRAALRTALEAEGGWKR